MTAGVLSTTIGDLPLQEVKLSVGERSWSILHTGALISREEEHAFLHSEEKTKRPYGIILWPAAIALAHELATRDLRGTSVLELGAGTGLPGIVAASLGARVVQTDRHSVALHVCKMNAARNGVDGAALEHRKADWTEWGDKDRYDLVVGSDILYSESMLPFLRRIFETNLRPGGSVLVADPYRASSIGCLEKLEAEGWGVTLDKWTIGERPIGLFAVTAPRARTPTETFRSSP